MNCNGGDSEEELETSQPTSDENELFPHNASETNMSDNVSSVETELNVENILTEEEEEDPAEYWGKEDSEEEDPAEYCSGGFHPVTLGDFWDMR